MQTETLAPDDAGIARAADLLRQGAVVAIPTETVYGLAGDARNGDAVASIYQAKGRPSFNPLIVHVPDLQTAQRYVVVNNQAQQLAQAFWPGALTMVLPLRADAGIASLVTAGLPTLAVRVPAHPVARALLRSFDGPLAAPSANPSGRISPTTVAHVTAKATGLWGRIPAVLDGGAAQLGLESTIIGWQGARPALMRPGGIATEAIEALLAQPLLMPQIDPNAPTTPGQLLSHYAPNAAVRLNATDAQGQELLIGFGAVKGELTLSDTGDLAEAASRLFDILHRADATGRPIAVAPVPMQGLGVAINDRLTRAAAPR